ncbi:MAG: polysaccharide biosynthesis protein [Planctomycetota bacterium]
MADGPTPTLLIGTARSLRQLIHTLHVAEPPVAVLGAVLPESASADADPGCPVLGRLSELAVVLNTDTPEQVLLTLPLAMQKAIGKATALLDRAAVTWRFLPTLDDQLAGRTSSRVTGALPTSAGTTPSRPAAGALDPALLIDRTPKPLDEPTIAASLAGKRVLITGAGGSIGSELARTVCRFHPAELTLVERAESPLFEIDRELARAFPSLPRRAELHDITRRGATADLLRRVKPDVVFHAAAHKHVPMMEVHPTEAIENNVYGTRHLADASAAAGVSRFVMISTDKAVNPSSVMGASKRLAELYIQHVGQLFPDTVFATVRFGNVLGSVSSVLTIWADQLARGGPITVTHPEMQRYFMTIPEAAGLVLQAGALSKGGEVFLLDMGQPLRVLDLAHRFIRLHGFEPNQDMPVQITGVRPGEKLFEELAYHSEGMIPTAHDSIRIWQTDPPSPAIVRQTHQRLDRLRNGPPKSPAARSWSTASRNAVLTALHAAVPEMVAAAAG